MLKIIFKQPVGGFITQSGTAARSVQYVWSPGFLTEEFRGKYCQIKKINGVLFFVDAIAALAGQTIKVDGSERQMGFFIDPDNIAWIQEFPDSVRNTESDFKRVG